jgi:transposase
LPEKRRQYDSEFRAGAVRIVQETGKPMAQVARDLGVNEGTLVNWVTRARRAADASATGKLSEPEREELRRLREENARLRKDNVELGMEREVLKRSVVLWVKESMK